MRLYVPEERMDDDGGITTVYAHNSNIDYVCPCSNPDCRGYGTRSQYGRDEFCPDCKKPLDWSQERKW